MERLRETLARAHVVPVIRRATPDAAELLARRLLDAGMPVIELTATTPGWPGTLRRLRGDHPDAVIGVGTVTSLGAAREALDAGAGFLVSPWPVPEIHGIAAERGIPLCEGGFTPSEIASAASRGIAKLFPAHAVGPAYLRSLMAVLPPGSAVMPTGGITIDAVPAWLAAGALAVGIGSDLDRLAEVWREL